MPSQSSQSAVESIDWHYRYLVVVVVLFFVVVVVVVVVVVAVVVVFVSRCYLSVVVVALIMPIAFFRDSRTQAGDHLWTK